MLLKLSNILKQCDNTSWILVDKPFKQRFQKYFSNKHEKGYTYVSVFLPSAAEFKKTRTVLAGISCISSIRTCPESKFLVASSIFFLSIFPFPKSHCSEIMESHDLSSAPVLNNGPPVVMLCFTTC